MLVVQEAADLRPELGEDLPLDLRGPLPQLVPPQPYTPSPFEWGVSAGLIAAAIFLFAWGVRVFPVLPKDEETAAA